MEIAKPTDADKDRFRSLAPEAPNVELKPMFGNIAAFVNGNMFMGLFGPAIGVRLDEATRDELLAVDGAGPFGPEDRPMREYVSLPPDLDDHAAGVWIDRSLAHVAAMPPKSKKPKRR